MCLKKLSKSQDRVRYKFLFILSTLIVLLSQPALSQTTSQIGARFATAPALSSSAVTDLDFGTWAVNIGGSDTPSFSVHSDSGGMPSVASLSGVAHPSTVVENTIPPSHPGEVLLTSPIPGAIQISANVIADFSHPSVSLQNLVYTDSASSNVALPSSFDGSTFVNVSGASERIFIGGTLALGQGGSNVPEDTEFSDAIIEVSFSY